MSAPQTLSPTQARALFDILVHHETYSEIENFKWPKAIHEYGHPFIKANNEPANSPLLQMLLNRFALKLPGLKTIKLEFWQQQVSTFLEKLSAAELSESYERGSLGARKTVATAISAIFEYLGRGIVGGFHKGPAAAPAREYDTSNVDDVLAAWEDFTQGLVYGNLVNELFKKAAETEKIEDHSPVVRAAHEFIRITLAAFVHHILILSPEGPYLLKLIENAHRLIPYALIRQTLKVGNAATMINGMIRVVLAKISVTAVTNWLGLSKNPDDGMNLLQTIMSTVLRWDISDFQKQIVKIEKTKDTLSREQIDALKSYLKKPREDHEAYREESVKKSRSIVAVIFEKAALANPASETQLSLGLQYLKNLHEIRDREELIRVLCKHSPDMLTQIIKDVVAAFDPIIRSLHNAADLSGGLYDLECFINDLIKLSKPKPDASGNVQLPTVGAYNDLLGQHNPALNKFLHQIAKNGPELTDLFRGWTHEAFANFKEPELAGNDMGSAGQNERGAGAATEVLIKLVQDLPESDQQQVKAFSDAHASYLEKLGTLSIGRMKAIVNGSFDTTSGPGMYLAKWQSLLDNTLVTPVKSDGPVRHGSDPEVKKASKKGPADESKKAEADKMDESIKASEELPKAPDATVVISLLGPKFREHLAQGIS